MTDEHRRKMGHILSHVIEERFSVEQLDCILHTCIALTWSEETDKIARAAYGLTKEILHRDCAAGRPEPGDRHLMIALPSPVIDGLALRRDAHIMDFNEELNLGITGGPRNRAERRHGRKD